MTAATVTVTKTSELVGGDRLVRGTITFSGVYITGGIVADLSTYLSGTPTVTVGQQNATYRTSHDGGTAAAGVVLAHCANGDEVANAFNTYNVTCSFIAVGTAT